MRLSLSKLAPQPSAQRDPGISWSPCLDGLLQLPARRRATARLRQAVCLPQGVQHKTLCDCLLDFVRGCRFAKILRDTSEHSDPVAPYAGPAIGAEGPVTSAQYHIHHPSEPHSGASSEASIKTSGSCKLKVGRRQTSWPAIAATQFAETQKGHLRSFERTAALSSQLTAVPVKPATRLAARLQQGLSRRVHRVHQNG